MKKTIVLFFAILATASLQAASTDVNVRDFGAKGDGKTLDSPAINAAIDHCAQQGGGTVVLPAGNYLSGAAGKNAVSMEKRTGFCLETQFFPA